MNKNNRKLITFLFNILTFTLLCVLYIIYIPQIMDFGINERIYYLLLWTFTLPITYFLFHILSSKSNIKGEATTQKGIYYLRFIWKAGGAATLSIIIVLIYYFFVPEENSELIDLTVKVYYKDNLQSNLSDIQNIILDIPDFNEPKKGIIGEGTIFFQNIPINLLGKDVKFNLISTKYELIKKNYKMNKVIEIDLKQKKQIERNDTDIFSGDTYIEFLVNLHWTTFLKEIKLNDQTYMKNNCEIKSEKILLKRKVKSGRLYKVIMTTSVNDNIEFEFTPKKQQINQINIFDYIN